MIWLMSWLIWYGMVWYVLFDYFILIIWLIIIWRCFDSGFDSSYSTRNGGTGHMEVDRPRLPTPFHLQHKKRLRTRTSTVALCLCAIGKKKNHPPLPSPGPGKTPVSNCTIPLHARLRERRQKLRLALGPAAAPGSRPSSPQLLEADWPGLGEPASDDWPATPRHFPPECSRGVLGCLPSVAWGQPGKIIMTK